QEDFKILANRLLDWKNNSDDILQINVYETGTTINKWKAVTQNNPLDDGYYYDWWSSNNQHSDPKPEPKPNPQPPPTTPSPYPSPVEPEPEPDPEPTIERWTDESNFWNEYKWGNQIRYQNIGLDENELINERRIARDNWYKGNRTKVAVIEANGVLSKNSSIYTSRDIITIKNVSDKHADHVSEIIIGKQGINPYATLYADAGIDWTSYRGIINNAIENGAKIINKSWGISENDDTDYNEDAEWLDNVIIANPEVIFVQAAGNDADIDLLSKDEKTNWDSQRYTNSFRLSLNSIVVGSISDPTSDTAQPFSERASKDNYISVSTVDTFFPSSVYVRDEDDGVDGTSFSAASVTGMISLLKSNYPSYFDEGADSLIMKSALIEGARNRFSEKFKYARIKKKDKYIVNNDVYNFDTGFGTPKYASVRESLEHLDYFNLTEENIESNPHKKYVYLDGGSKYRVNISWLNISSIVHGDFIGPIPLNLTLENADDSKVTINAVDIYDDKGNVQKANTKTMEFAIKKSGVYTFNVSFTNKETRNKGLDIALTYSRL
ncbi:hypothetical protein CJJ23_04785, partial [Mycoplasmopsis agassizii]